MENFFNKSDDLYNNALSCFIEIGLIKEDDMNVGEMNFLLSKIEGRLYTPSNDNEKLSSFINRILNGYTIEKECYEKETCSLLKLRVKAPDFMTIIENRVIELNSSGNKINNAFGESGSAFSRLLKDDRLSLSISRYLNLCEFLSLDPVKTMREGERRALNRIKNEMDELLLDEISEYPI